MILKNFVGKTIEAAQKSAKQMLGDDVVVLNSTPEKDGNEAQITVMADKKNQSGAGSDVEFERSTPNLGGGNNGLTSLRKFAESQLAGESNAGNKKTDPKENGTAFSPGMRSGKNGASAENLYSRASIRKNTNGLQNKNYLKNNATDKTTGKPEESPKKKTFSSHFNTEVSSAVQAASTRKNQREINALHKRFDKLESLLDSALISANLDYVSHPAFQQLVKTGISTSVIARWFGEIIKQGVDPYEQPSIFMSHLSALIRNALGDQPSDETQRFLMFTGPSGSGKTSLIMKLIRHTDFMLNKKMAIVSMRPRGDKSTYYYSVLEPFCNDFNVPYFEIKSGVEITKLQEEWEAFDHVLIDTPPISITKEEGFREYWEMRQMLASVTPLEVHYVVNASLNQFYFKHSSASHHPLQPDYIALTHLDEISQWGPIIPFMKQMACGVRYVSTGNAIPNSLNEFNPQWFAQKLLQVN